MGAYSIWGMNYTLLHMFDESEEWPARATGCSWLSIVFLQYAGFTVHNRVSDQALVGGFRRSWDNICFGFLLRHARDVLRIYVRISSLDYWREQVRIITKEKS